MVLDMGFYLGGDPRKESEGAEGVRLGKEREPSKGVLLTWWVVMGVMGNHIPSCQSSLRNLEEPTSDNLCQKLHTPIPASAHRLSSFPRHCRKP